jgi:uncharacterized protein (TIGR01777 family)
MNILVTGATGFIGQALIQRLLKQHKLVLLSRSRAKAEAIFVKSANKGNCIIIEHLQQIAEQDRPHAVINLAGEGIADKRWSDKRKQLIRDSRILFTENLVNWLSKNAPDLKVMISGSAMGFYGSQAPAVLLDENAAIIDGFTHQLCDEWEQQAMRLQSQTCRVCLLRSGIVLGKNGGALAKLLPIFRLGLGGPIASGQQMMSWVHIDDMIRAITFLLDKQVMQGPFNIASPRAVSNQVFSNTLGKVLHRPAICRVPALIIKLMLGEGAELLVQGQNIVPRRLLDQGFNFQYEDLAKAMAEITNKENLPIN